MAAFTRDHQISIEDADVNIGFTQLESNDDMGIQTILKQLAKNVQSIHSDVREMELLEISDDIDWDILLLSES